MMKSYCVRCRMKTENVNPQTKISKNKRWYISSRCGVKKCGKKKSEFISRQYGKGKNKWSSKGVGIRKKQKTKQKIQQKGGALARNRPRTIDKVAEGMSMFLSGPPPSFAKLGLKIGSTGAKAIKSIIDQHRR